MRRGFVAHVEHFRSVCDEQEDARLLRDAVVGLVQDGAAEGEAFQVARVAVRVGAGEDALALGEAAEDQLRSDEQLLRQLNDLVGAVLEHEQQLVELGALQLEFVAVDLVAEVAALAVVGDLEGLERDGLGIQFLVAAALAGEARILRAVFGEEPLEMRDGVGLHVLEVFFHLGQLGLELVHLFAVLADVEERDPADADLQEALDVRVGQGAGQLGGEGLEAIHHGGVDGLVRFALLDLLVDALLDEDALQRAEIEVFLQLALAQLQLAFEQGDELVGVRAQHLAHGELDGPVVADDDDAAGEADLAVGEGVERVDELLGFHAGRGADLDFHVLAGEVVDGLDLDLAFARGVLDGGGEGLGGDAGRQLLDDDGGLVLDLDLGAHGHAAFAVLIIPRVHQAAGGEVWQAFERLVLQDRNLRLQQLGEVVRQQPRRKADGDALGAKHERQRQPAGQRDRLLVAPVVAGHELGQLVVEELFPRERREPALDVTRRGGGVAGVDVAEVALTLDEIALVREHHERIADGGVTVRVILHRMADHVGDLDEPAVVLLAQGPEDAPVHGLQTIREMRDGAVADDVGRVFEKACVHTAVEGAFDLRGIENMVRYGGRFLDDDVRRAAVAVRLGDAGSGFWGGRIFPVPDGQFRLAGLGWLLR